ncbi:hypothetical protein [Natrinema sp. DC36]|uniref:hypothetical protein n=1 Tax=Natrinema sp. DC36 TaxID=2878680 RepID=UPI001CF0CE0B|nr:hypothetical protein [Natrinema sp. DC36]
MAEPDMPSKREEAVHTTLQDYEALYLCQMLREWAAYHSDDVESSIAKGYIEWMQKNVRKLENNAVDIYAHTPKAAETLNKAIEQWANDYREQLKRDVYSDISSALIDLWGRHHSETVNADAGRQEYDPAPSLDI